MSIQSMTTQMKATEKYFPVVLFTIPYEAVLTFESSVTIQMKAME